MLIKHVLWLFVSLIEIINFIIYLWLWLSPSEEQTHMTFVVLFHAKTDSEVSFTMLREHFVVLIEISMHLIKCNP